MKKLILERNTRVCLGQVWNKKTIEDTIGYIVINAFPKNQLMVHVKVFTPYGEYSGDRVLPLKTIKERYGLVGHIDHTDWDHGTHILREVEDKEKEVE